MKEIQHISSLKLTNFKQFKELEIDNIGQFNLIVGDNNVGKTSLLEALLVHYDEGSKFDIWFERLLKALDEFHGLRLKSELFFQYYVNADHLDQDSEGHLGLDVEFVSGKDWSLNIGFSPFLDTSITYSINGDSAKQYFSANNQRGIHDLPIPLIPPNISSNKLLGEFYSQYIQPSQAKKREFISQLKVLVDDLENIELSGITDELPLIFYREGQDAAIPLAMYGEGTIKLARLLMELQIWRGQRLMIDEIDTGIYYKRMPDFWRTLISGAESSDVQLFATTHNKDCLDTFTRVFEREEFRHLRDKARVLKMTRLPDGSVKMYTYEFDQFQNALEVQYEIR